MLRRSYRHKSEGARTISGIEINRSWFAIGGVSLLFAFVWAYWPALVNMVEQWRSQPDYSHGFLVVPLSLFFLWMKRSQFPRDQLRPSLYGAGILLIASLFRLISGAYFLAPLDGWTIP